MGQEPLTEQKTPFDDVELAHSVLDALGQCGYHPEHKERFRKALQNVEFGLSAEHECAAILAWLGNCTLVHGLGQRVHTSATRTEVQVPDLVALFEKHGKAFTSLVEVKSTNDLHLRWTKDYSRKLQAYAQVVGLPLLLAWRCRTLGEWVLLDPLAEGLVEGAKISIERAMMYNLMGVVAGDFRVEPQPGVGLNFRGKFVGGKSPTKEGYQATVQGAKAFWGTPNGMVIAKPNASVCVLLLTTATEEYCEEIDGGLSWGHLTPARSDQCPFVCAQTLLRAIIGWKTKQNERIAWRHVLVRLNEMKSRAQMEKELSESFGQGVSYIFDIMPECVPAFLPPGWGEVGG